MRLLIVVVAGLVLAGCSPAEGPTESPSVSVEPSPTVEPTTLAPSPSPTVESVSPSPSPTVFESYPGVLPTDDPESAAIIEGWQEYQRVRQKYLSDPVNITDLTEATYVTVGEEANEIVDTIQLYRENRIRSLGGLTFHDVSVSESRPTGEGGQSQVDLSYCVDRSNAEVVTSEGGDFARGELEPRFHEVSTLEQGLDGIWRVALVRNSNEPC